MELIAGLDSTDDILLTAGNDFTDGSIDLNGDGSIDLRAGDGNINFVNGATASVLATLSPAGMFTATNDLVAGGNEVHLGTPGSTRFVRNPANDDVYIARDEDQNHAASTFSIFTNVGVQQMRINDGDEAPAFFDGAVNANGLDYAEAFLVSDPTLAAGEVVVFDPARPGHVARADAPYSTLLAGVISEKPGFLTGGSFDAEEAADPALAQQMKAAYAEGDYAAAKEVALVLEQKKIERQRPVALAGRLPVKVDASYGPIAAGDHLTSSPTPGHAMAMHDAGPSIGVALESFAGKGTGTILAFVQRGHYTPTSLITGTQTAQAQLASTVAARTPDPVSGVQVLPANLQVEPGDVLVVDRDQPGGHARSRAAGDPAVVGVVASEPGIVLGGDMSRLLGHSQDLADALADARARNARTEEEKVWAEVERRFAATHAFVALSGTVGVKVDASHGAIAPGDLLVASPTPGHAMRAPVPAPEGAVIGKALEAIGSGAGVIRMLVMLR